MNKKLIFFDVDGTLVYNKEIKLSTIEAINKLKELGHTIFIATGRTMSLLDEINSTFKPDGYVILNGKGAFYKGDLVFNQVIDSSLVNDIYEECKSRNDCLTCLDTKEYMSGDLNNSYLIKFCEHLEFPMPTYHTKNDMFNREICTLGLHTKDVTHYKNKFPMFNYIRVNDYGYDVIFGDEVKGYGCRIVREKLGFSIDDTIAFGDNLNDLDMFNNVGISIAMGNANPLVKENATFITKDSLDDGIYYALHNYLKLI